LPVTIFASITKPGSTRADALSWDAQWKNNVKFDPKDFVPIAPAPAKSAKPSKPAKPST
jgi:hypothetical protein